MKASIGQRCLVLYSGALTLAVCVALLSGFADLHGPRFDTITVQRINIVEPDGTLRMVISDNSRIPGIVMHGKEYPDFSSRKASTAAGMLFYDAEGSESGGLTFGGRKDSQGAITRFGHLSFDRYEQDQMFTIDAVDDGTNHRSSIQMIDQPNWSIVEYLELLQAVQGLPESERQARIDQFFDTHSTAGVGVRTNLSNENYPDAPQSSRNAVHFFDRKNTERLEAGLDNNDSPALEVRDERGNLIERVPPAQ